jgi:hypothetical protein
MKIKNRYTTWNLRLVTLNKAQQRLRRRKEYNFKLSLSDILMSISAILLIDADSVIANFAREGVEWQIAAILALITLFGIGLILKFRRKAPRPCWTRMSWGTSMMAVGCTIVAYVMWWCDEFTLEQAHVMALCCSPLYVLAIVSIVRLRYIRRRSLAEIAVMRMRRARRRNYDY